MALESLQRFEFTTKSDVWSYGVMLYEVRGSHLAGLEVFSMGDHPYITVPPDDMVEYLKSGHRLEKPEACPEVL